MLRVMPERLSAVKADDTKQKLFQSKLYNSILKIAHFARSEFAYTMTTV